MFKVEFKGEFIEKIDNFVNSYLNSFNIYYIHLL